VAKRDQRRFIKEDFKDLIAVAFATLLGDLPEAICLAVDEDPSSNT
jgi:hypothetical protein